MALTLSRKRSSQGRRKIDIKLIEDENARVVTFSKRRAGLFKKATELSILCGTQIAIIVFSMGGRAYSFGHPSVEAILDRFSNRTPMPPHQHEAESSSRTRADLLHQIKQQCDERNEQLELRKKRVKEIEAALEGSPYLLTQERLDELNLFQMMQIKKRMEWLREEVTKCINGGGAQVEMVNADVAAEVVADVAAEEGEKVVNLANVEKDGLPIPADWLKL